MSAGQRLTAIRAGSTESLGEIPPEALVTLVRWCRISRDKYTENAAVATLIRKAEHNINAAFRDAGRLHPARKNDIMEEILSNCMAGWCSTEEQHAFWEVRFWVMLQRRIADAKRALRAENNHRVNMVPYPNSEEDPIAQLPDHSALDPETQALISNALEMLPDNERKAFLWVRVQRMPESDAAGFLGVTDRTVRNYIVRAEQKLEAWRRSDRR